MQILWSRAAQFKSTCCCSSCVAASKQGLSRSTTNDAVQLARLRFYGHRFSFYSSSILAGAAFADSFNKDRKQKELSLQIAEARKELIARQADQDRRLEALGIRPDYLEEEDPLEDRSVREASYEETANKISIAWYKEKGEAWLDEKGKALPDENGKVWLDKKDEASPDKKDEARSSATDETLLDGKGDIWFDEKVHGEHHLKHAESPREVTTGRVHGTGPRRYKRARNRFVNSILKFHSSERQNFEPTLTEKDELAGNLKASTEPLKWFRSPRLHRQVKELENEYSHSRTISGEGLDSDLWVPKMRDNPGMDNEIEHQKTCQFEHQVYLDLYLQSLRRGIKSDDPRGIDEPRNWCSLLEWAHVQRIKRERLGFGQVPGISIQELQAFTPKLLEEITENDSIMDMVRGMPSEDAARVLPFVKPLSDKKAAVMTMAVYKLVLSVLHLFSERENAHCYQQQRPLLPTESRQRLIDFWSYYIRASSEATQLQWSEDKLAYPIPPLPVYYASFDFRQKYEDKLHDVIRILHSRYSHETTMNLVCIELLRSNVPIDIHVFNQILIYLCTHYDYGLVALFLQCMDECHLRPNEITVSWRLRYYILTGRRHGFQRYVAKMYGRDDSLMLRNPMLRIPLLARPKFVIEKRLKHRKESPKNVELQDTSYRPFPSGQQLYPRIYEKARRNREVYSQLIQGALTFGHIEDALRYFIEMIQHGWECTATAFVSLLKHFTDMRDWAAGFGVWERRNSLVQRPDAKVYIQVLKLCIVCGKRTEYQQILTDGIRSKALDQETAWPATTVYKGDVVSTQLSWVIGLEAELRNVTHALSLEVERIKRCIENASGDTVLYPVHLQSHRWHENEVATPPGPATTIQQDDTVGNHMQSSTRDFKPKKPKKMAPKTLIASLQLPSDKLYEKLGATAAEQSNLDATRARDRLEETKMLEAQHEEPDWSYYDFGLKSAENCIEPFKELEKLLSWPEAPGYPTPQDMEDQEYVVVPAMHYRNPPYGPGATRDRGRGVRNEFLTFRSVQLDPYSEPPPVSLDPMRRVEFKVTRLPQMSPRPEWDFSEKLAKLKAT